MNVRRTWLIRESQTSGTYGLRLYAHGDLGGVSSRAALYIDSRVTVYGTLDELETLARAILDEVRAIRADRRETSDDA